MPCMVHSCFVLSDRNIWLTILHNLVDQGERSKLQRNYIAAGRACLFLQEQLILCWLPRKQKFKKTPICHFPSAEQHLSHRCCRGILKFGKLQVQRSQIFYRYFKRLQSFPLHSTMQWGGTGVASLGRCFKTVCPTLCTGLYIAKAYL